VAILLALPARAFAQDPLADGKAGLVELGKADARLQGIFAPKGFKVQVVASEPAIVDPVSMAFDDQGNLYVAEWTRSERTFDTWDVLNLPEGGTTRIRRRRKGTTDVIKRLKDADGDGVYESSEVVVEGVEQPLGLFPWRNTLGVASLGRLEQRIDDDGDGSFETRKILVDGFAAGGRGSLSGVTLGLDGWLYLTVGDSDTHAVGSDGSRVDLVRTGGVVRCRPDGSQLQALAIGLRDPRGNLALNAAFDPFVIDGGLEDGSKFQPARLVNPVEGGDYGWRLRPGSNGGEPDFDRAAADGERPGKLPVVARLGRAVSAGLTIYNGVALPETCRDLIIAADPARRAIRGYKAKPRGGSQAIEAETTLLAANPNVDFRPIQTAIGADGALYILDGRSSFDSMSPAAAGPRQGRLYRVTWEGDARSPALPTRPNHWGRVLTASNDQLIAAMASADFAEADRAQRELLDRSPPARGPFLAYALNPAVPLHCRALAIEGARQLWNDEVEAAMLRLLDDPLPDVRRLAAQGLAWEPKTATPRLVTRLVEHLNDADGRVAREVALGVARHSEGRPAQAAVALGRWLFGHPRAEIAVRDGFLRALERMGDAGVEEIALAIRTKTGTERELAVGLFAGFRSAQAADQLPGLVKVPDLTGPERLALVRQFAEIPVEISLPTTGLADWVARHGDVEPAVKVAALEACRLAGNPASTLVLALLDDDDETVRLAATRIAARVRPPGALATLGERLKDANRTTAERLAIVRALRGAGPSAYAALEGAFKSSDEPLFKASTLRSMAEVDRIKALSVAEAALAGDSGPLKDEAVRILGETPASSLKLGKAFLDGTLTRAELPAVLEALRKHDGAEHRRLLANIDEDFSKGLLAVSPTDLLARARKGDPWAGLGVFFATGTARCSTCHTLEDKGVPFGPSPLGEPRALAAEGLIEAILSPSRQIHAGFELSRVIMKDGKTLAGIITSRDAKMLTLKQRDGREVRVGRDAIDREVKETVSPMPGSLALEVSPDELANLVSFLLSQPARDALKHGPKKVERVLAIGPLAPGADKLRIPLDRVDPARPVVGQDGAATSWTGVESTTGGIFDFRGQFGPRPGRAFLAFQVRSPKEQEVALRFGVEGGARVYLNGSKLIDVPEHEAGRLAPALAPVRPGQLRPWPELARLPLRTGWNTVIVALDRSDSGAARAGFEIASPEPIELRTPRPGASEDPETDRKDPRLGERTGGTKKK
jgi:quinoprotein glucose dehydrogenase